MSCSVMNLHRAVQKVNLFSAILDYAQNRILIYHATGAKPDANPDPAGEEEVLERPYGSLQQPEGKMGRAGGQPLPTNN